MGLLDGRAGLVSGAASGIGRASAIEFAAEGASVVVADVDDAGGAETVEMIRAAGGEATYERCDVTVETEVAAMVQAVVDHYGRIDWAHNNAGVNAPVAPTGEQQAEWWERVLHIDLIGVMFAIKHQVNAMVAQGGGGAIVNTASMAGLQSRPGMSQYSAAKWGVVSLTRTSAREYASQGIRVNAICPGMTRTPGVATWAESVPDVAKQYERAIPMGRMARPEEQAKVAVWLCSDSASYVTGVALPVDGGSGA